MKKSNRTQPIIVAHRGLHGDLPENSLEAFDAAWRAGLKWCECDVRFSADGVPILMHDATLNRTTSSKGSVAEQNWKKLAKIRLRSDKGKISEARIPSLSQLIERLPNKKKLLVEIKPIMTAANAFRVIDLLKDVPCIVQSFRAENLILLRYISPKLKLAYLMEHRERFEVGLAGDWEGLNVEHRWADQSIALRCDNSGKRFSVWTPNTRNECEQIMELSPYMIITDRPDIAMDATNRSKSGNNRTVNRVADRDESNVRRRRKSQRKS